jgi:hypothetical protein
MIDKRDHDLNRLRDARDALTSELHERKTKDAEKINAASQSKILANARAVRPLVFSSRDLDLICAFRNALPCSSLRTIGSKRD